MSTEETGVGAESPRPSAVDMTGSLALEPTPQAAREARRFVARFCAAADLPEEVCQTAALLTSELVTNAVLHGRTRATLHATKPPPCLRLAVEDHNPGLPAIGDHPSLDATSGRGLQIVAALANRWGIEATDTGKAIWFELDVPPAAPG